jgi:hypothetical protein
VENPETICPKCQNPVLPTDFFCPNCGNKLKENITSTGIAKQIGIYLLSFFLPPFGIWPAIKYLRQKDSKSKTIGAVAIVLTILSLTLSFYFTKSFIDNFQSQLKIYDQIGF